MMFGSYVYSIADNVTIHPLRLGLNEDHESFGRSGMRTKMSVLHTYCRFYHAATLVKFWDTVPAAVTIHYHSSIV
jgi:hypothetical protein